jgi:hypothetical protein
VQAFVQVSSIPMSDLIAASGAIDINDCLPGHAAVKTYIS